MRKLLLLCFVVIVSSIRAQNPPPSPPGCNPYFVLDDGADNIFDIDIQQYLSILIPPISAKIQYDLAANYEFQVYGPLEGDGQILTGINTITSPDFTTQLGFIYVGPGPEYVPDGLYTQLSVFSCYYIRGVDPLGDEDNDGISNADEDANNDGVLNDDTDGDGAFDFEDSNDLALDPVVAQRVSIYPNPASDDVFVSGIDTSFGVQIITMNGQIIKTYKDVLKLDVSDVTPGFYLLKINSLDQTFFKKLVIR